MTLHTNVRQQLPGNLTQPQADQTAQLNNALLPAGAGVRAALNVATGGPRHAVELVQTIPSKRQVSVSRALVWLVKTGILRVCS